MQWIHRDGYELDRVEQSEQVSANDSRLLLPALGLNYLDPDVGRGRVRAFVLIEALPIDSVGESLQNKWAILNRRENEARDARVVPHHISLRVFLLREKNL